MLGSYRFSLPVERKPREAQDWRRHLETSPTISSKLLGKKAKGNRNDEGGAGRRCICRGLWSHTHCACCSWKGHLSMMIDRTHRETWSHGRQSTQEHQALRTGHDGADLPRQPHRSLTDCHSLQSSRARGQEEPEWPGSELPGGTPWQMGPS